MDKNTSGGEDYLRLCYLLFYYKAFIQRLSKKTLYSKHLTYKIGGNVYHSKIEKGNGECVNAYNNSKYMCMNIRMKQKLNRIMMEIKSIDRGNIYHNEYHKTY